MLLPTILSLLATLVYIPPYKLTFVGDDYVQLGYIAPFLEQPAAALRVFDPFWSDWYFRPLQNIWFLICRLIFGLNPFGYYFLQALWHLMAGASLVAFARKLGVTRGSALIALTLFLVHSHHHDVVAWISSIATIQVTTFSLLAFAAYAHYRQGPRQTRWLLAATLFTLLALFSHEVGIFMPPFLLLIRRGVKGRASPRRIEQATLALLIAVAAAMSLLHGLRPNATIVLGGEGAAGWLATLHLRHLAQFTVIIAGRWLLLNKTALGTALLLRTVESTALAVILFLLVALALAVAYRRGQGVTRLALLWAVAHLAFIYLTVWRQKPELLAGRHLYAPWAMLVVAIGHQVAGASARRPRRTARPLFTVLAVVLALNILFVGDDQRAWQSHTDEVARVERQMKALIPQAGPQTQIYAHRFVILPSFTPYAAAIWYNEPQLSGGSLARLQSVEQVHDQTFVLDYAGGQLSNVLPELQAYPGARILWQPLQASVSAVQADGAESGSYQLLQVPTLAPDRRLAIAVQPPPDAWLTLHYAIPAAESSHLVTAILGEAGAVFRVRLSGDGGAAQTVFRRTVDQAGAVQWHHLRIPLAADGIPRLDTILLDVQAPPGVETYWSMPLLVQLEE